VTKRAALVTVVRVSGLILLAVVGTSAAPPPATSKLGYSELSNGRGGTNVELFVLPDGFDKARSLAAFKTLFIPSCAPTARGATARKINWEVELRLRCTRMST